MQKQPVLRREGVGPGKEATGRERSGRGAGGGGGRADGEATEAGDVGGCRTPTIAEGSSGLTFCPRHQLLVPEAAGDLGSSVTQRVTRLWVSHWPWGSAQILAGCAQHQPGVRTGGCVGPMALGPSAHGGCLQTLFPRPRGLCKAALPAQLTAPMDPKPPAPSPQPLSSDLSFFEGKRASSPLATLRAPGSRGSLSQSSSSTFRDLLKPSGSPDPLRAREFSERQR